MQKKILIIGSNGQIGTELYLTLSERYGKENVIASDIVQPKNELFKDAIFESIDVLNANQVKVIVEKHQVEEVYLLAALLSATSEKNPEFAWKLNMEGLFNVLNLAKDNLIKKVFWPSSIAVFGPDTPKDNTPQHTIMQPTTVYGISKVAGEQWCQYYFNKFGVDVRSIRYPGLIGYKSAPGGGTTDYAVDIFHKAISDKSYTCFLEGDAALPMMYMDDAIRATIAIMDAPREDVKIRTSYNLAGISFTPEQISSEIKKHIPDFKIDYEIDFRNDIAASWPNSINDESASTDWGWKNQYDLAKLVDTMLTNLR